MLGILEGSKASSTRAFSSDAAITAETCRQLTNSNPALLYTILLDVDSAGHSYGWGPAVTNYVRAIETADRQVRQIIVSQIRVERVDRRERGRDLWDEGSGGRPHPADAGIGLDRRGSVEGEPRRPDRPGLREPEAGRTRCLARARVRSPAVAWLRIPLGSGFGVMAAHERRHLWQARKITGAPGFPTGT